MLASGARELQAEPAGQTQPKWTFSGIADDLFALGALNLDLHGCNFEPVIEFPIPRTLGIGSWPLSRETPVMSARSRVGRVGSLSSGCATFVSGASAGPRM